MKKTIFRRIALVAAVVLLVILIGFQLLPLTYNEASLLGQTDLQATRGQRIAKDAFVLEYRPESEHAQAVNELQNTLPLWEAQQTALHMFHNPDLQTLLIQAQPDYLALDTATKKLLANPTDRTQVDIIAEHERNYSLLMLQLSALLQARIQAFSVGLIVIQTAITALVVAAAATLFVLSRPKTPGKETS